MFFLQATRAPVNLVIGSLKGTSYLRLTVPKYQMDDVIAWGQRLHAAALAQATEGMDDQRKREYMQFYGKVTPTFEELKQMLRTPEGVKEVILNQLPKAKAVRVFPSREGKRERVQPIDNLTVQQVEEYYSVNGPGRLAGLAIVLADMNDSSVVEDPNPDPDEQENRDPLPKRGKGGTTN